jgi:hypothetical protein
LDLLKDEKRQRWRAALDNARGRVGPGDDRSSARRGRAFRRDHHAGDCDRLAVKAARTIKNAPGGNVSWRLQHRFAPDDRARRAFNFLRRRLIEGALGESVGDADGEKRQRHRYRVDSATSSIVSIEPHGLTPGLAPAPPEFPGGDYAPKDSQLNGVPLDVFAAHSIPN